MARSRSLLNEEQQTVHRLCNAASKACSHSSQKEEQLIPLHGHSFTHKFYPTTSGTTKRGGEGRQWLQFRKDLSENCRRATQLRFPTLSIGFADTIYNLVLTEIENKTLALCSDVMTTYGLPPAARPTSNDFPSEIVWETSYDITELYAYVQINEALLLPDQKHAYDAIVQQVQGRKGGIFFLNTPGRTGKAFVTRLILAKVGLQKCIAMAVETSDIAAILLPGGRTAHSTFKLPLNLTSSPTPVCNISKMLDNGQLLTQCRLINPTRAHPLSEHFVWDILLLGNGEVPEDRNEDVDISSICTRASTIQRLQDQVFPGLEVHNRDLDWLCLRAILAPKNVAVSAINNSHLLCLPGDVTVYNSVDTIPNQDELVDYPTEFLNSLEPSGVAPYILTLKVGSPVMLIRNLNPPTLCNGTCLVITKLLSNVIEATIMTVSGNGQDIFIPRIPLVPLAADLLFTFHRVQFLIRLSYTMSINKSQGQSLSVVGPYLAEPCFSHSQLYVGCSRVDCRNSSHAFIPSGKTKNVVYKEVL
ncbi:uncharacterized protein LOC115225476 [Octopus sinensis]|uniref:ATP-dependent DNA helicase n=1 Tax=Octopus sinensis TaxID=2607531 RepID=A0A6P7TK87_9MOLL|nr:uncharacterized protein LOC115225476 [Octopus sinensis]